MELVQRLPFPNVRVGECLADQGYPEEGPICVGGEIVMYSILHHFVVNFQ